MNKTKKWIKRALWGLLIMVLCLAGIIGFLLNFVLTPGKITPEVTRYINGQVNAKVYCERMELTFFSSFPHFAVQLKNGGILNEDFRKYGSDTLAEFKNCQLSFNVVKLLAKNVVAIQQVEFDQPKIFAVINEKGKANWEILPTDTTTVAAADTSGEGGRFRGYYLRRFAIKDAEVYYKDVATKTIIHVPKYDLVLKAKQNKRGTAFTIDTKSERLTFEHEGIPFVKSVNLALASKVNYEAANHTITISKSKVLINDTDFELEGKLLLDSARRQIHTDLQLALNINSLENLWKLLPASVIEKDGVDATGTVNVSAKVQGIYGRNLFPQIALLFHIKNGTLKYKDFPGKIDHLESDMTARIDFNQPDSSNVRINKCLVKGSGMYLDVKGLVTDVLQNPHVNTNILADIDFTKVHGMFPVNDSLQTAGQAHLDLQANFDLKELLAGKYHNLQASGNASLQELSIRDLVHHFELNTILTKLEFDNIRDQGTKRKLAGHIQMKDLNLNYINEHHVQVQDLKVTVGAKRSVDSTSAVHADLSLKNLKYQGPDSLKALARTMVASVDMTRKNRRSKPVIHSTFEMDSVGLKQQQQFVGIRKGKYDLEILRDQQKHWKARGKVVFNRLYAFSPKFPLPIRMMHSRITLDTNAVELNRARLKVGHSDFTLTGKIEHLFKKKGDTTDTKASLALQSTFLDANELMQFMADSAVGSKEIATAPGKAGEVTVDTNYVKTETKTIFQVPKGIDFTFNMDVKRLKWGVMDINDLTGNLGMYKGKIQLDDLSMKTLAVNILADINYAVQSDSSALMDFDFNMNDIQMANLVKVLPALDSLLPMSESFEGTVNFRIKGSAQLDENMEIKMKSVNGIAALKAKDLMVLDGPTFKELAKTLMFKNKEKNPIGYLNLEMVIENSHMQILPALLEIDRYRLAVGGIQRMDMSYDYHITVLKSPVPFKTGVDISGNLDDYKIHVTKAKYKYYFTDKKRLLSKADSSVINKRNEILDALGFRDAKVDEKIEVE
ncbi:hypothetical protein COR50_19220 [Chitinophaga caeni]|uniref:Uncharacterized protein n=1 Tax=Chitinophaga caeni TaxID=2029983 RepID=A0A291QZ23_9BACT|nr:AsmA-like C-terminal region-containing protein [Chitinophaga caeni]ATL49132.1 hypothetical protein COR50_19220 [Chitinophaga caeni]